MPASASTASKASDPVTGTAVAMSYDANDRLISGPRKLRVVLLTFAAALRRDGPTSSTSTS